MNALPILLLGGAALMMMGGKKKTSKTSKEPGEEKTIVYLGEEVPAYIADNEDGDNEMADIVVDIPLDSDVKLMKVRRFGVDLRKMKAAKGDLGKIKKGLIRRPAPPNMMGKRPEPIRVGHAKSKRIKALLADMEQVFVAEGVDLDYITPLEVTTLTKTPTHAVAIPPTGYWYAMAATLRDGFVPLRKAFGKPIVINNGYRPPVYNREVTCKRRDGKCVDEGTEGSRHQWFQALDLQPADATAENRVRLATVAAAFFLDRGHELEMGFGVYGKPKFPQGVHIDTGFERRTWGSAEHFINQVSGVA